jgi:hypothetical protein
MRLYQGDTWYNDRKRRRQQAKGEKVEKIALSDTEESYTLLLGSIATPICLGYGVPAEPQQSPQRMQRAQRKVSSLRSLRSLR